MMKLLLIIAITALTLELLVIKCESRAQPSALMAGGKEGDDDDDDDDMESKSSQLFEVLYYSSDYRDEFVRMAGYGEDKLSTVFIKGVVLCNQICLQDSQHNMLPVSGASVGVTCDGSNTQAKAKTDEYGEFVIDVPSQLHGIQDMEKACSVKVMQLPKNSPCHQSDFGTRPNGIIRLSSVGNGVRTYTTGRIVIFSYNKHSE